MGIKVNDGDSGIGTVVNAEQLPPDPVSEVSTVLTAIRDSHRAWPSMFPEGAEDAARFWISKQEPEGVRERAEKVILPKNKWNQEEVKYRFSYPYIDRLIANLRLFLMEDSQSQSYIMAAIEDGINYRGDDNKFRYKQLGGRTLFQDIVKNTERMREIGVVAHREEARRLAHSVIGKRVVT